MSLHTVRWRVARAVVAAALALGGYLLFIPQHRPDRSSLGTMIVSRTAVAGLPARARLSQSIDPSKSTFKATQRAARRDKDHTGLYAREWYVTNGAPPEVGIVLQLLPDAATARAVQTDVRRELMTAPSLSGKKASFGTRFSVPGVPAEAAAFALSDTANPSKGTVGYAYKTLFRHGRAVLTELSVTTDTTRSTAATVADTRAGWRLLEEVEPGFSLVKTHLPVVASIVYAVVALLVVAGAVVVPELAVALVRRRRQRRLERAEARARSQYLSRGRRTVKRQGAPPWAKPKRR